MASLRELMGNVEGSEIQSTLLNPQNLTIEALETLITMVKTDSLTESETDELKSSIEVIFNNILSEATSEGKLMFYPHYKKASFEARLKQAAKDLKKDVEELTAEEREEVAYHYAAYLESTMPERESYMGESDHDDEYADTDVDEEYDNEVGDEDYSDEEGEEEEVPEFVCTNEEVGEDDEPVCGWYGSGEELSYDEEDEDAEGVCPSCGSPVERVEDESTEDEDAVWDEEDSDEEYYDDEDLEEAMLNKTSAADRRASRMNKKSAAGKKSMKLNAKKRAKYATKISRCSEKGKTFSFKTMNCVKSNKRR